MPRFLLIIMAVAATGAMLVWAFGALRALRSGGSALPYLAMPNPLPDASRREAVVCLGHTDLDQAPVTGNGGLWMNASQVMFHSAAGTVSIPRPLRFAESTTSVPELGLVESAPMLSLGWTTSSGHDAVAVFRTPDATGWAIALRS